MNRKLLKHEYLRTRPLLGTIWGAAALFALAGGLLGLTGLPAISGLGKLLALVGAAAPLPATQLALGIDYWRANYQRTGYFVHTLPVRGATQYRVKLTWGLLASLVATLVSLAFFAWFAVVVAITDGHGVPALLDAVGAGWAGFVAAMPAWAWIVLPIVALFALAANLVQFYFAASVGSERRFNQLGAGGPIVVWFGLYVASQLAGFLFLFLIPFGLGVVDGKLAVVGVDWLQAMAANSNPQAMPFGIVPMLMVITAAVVWRTRLSWEKKVALV